MPSLVAAFITQRFSRAIASTNKSSQSPIKSSSSEIAKTAGFRVSSQSRSPIQRRTTLQIEMPSIPGTNA